MISESPESAQTSDCGRESTEVVSIQIQQVEGTEIAHRHRQPSYVVITQIQVLQTEQRTHVFRQSVQFVAAYV